MEFGNFVVEVVFMSLLAYIQNVAYNILIYYVIFTFCALKDIIKGP